MADIHRIRLQRDVSIAHTAYIEVWEKCCDPKRPIDQRLMAEWEEFADHLTAALEDLRTYLLAEEPTPSNVETLSRTNRTMELVVEEGEMIRRKIQQTPQCP